MNMNDEDYVMARYMHPNRGQHLVKIGDRNYGYRGGGGKETFLVHRDDVSTHSHLFQVVPDVPEPPKEQPTPPPAPRPVGPAREQRQPEPVVKTVPPPPVMREEEAGPAEEQDAGEVIERHFKEQRIDLQTLPGVTPAVAENLAKAGFNTPQAILEAGVGGLQEVKYVGEARAEALYAYVVERHGGDDSDE